MFYTAHLSRLFIRQAHSIARLRRQSIHTFKQEYLRGQLGYLDQIINVPSLE